LFDMKPGKEGMNREMGNSDVDSWWGRIGRRSKQKIENWEKKKSSTGKFRGLAN